MYYRRKILLSLLKEFGGRVSKLNFQKLLFLFSQSEKKAAFNFVPYKYGCYSFQAAADFSTLDKYGLIKEEEKYYELVTKDDFITKLTREDQIILEETKNNFGKYSTNQLIKYVYRNHPYYAINSKIANEKLNPNDYEQVEKSKPYSNETLLFTIGYEGISVEEYFNKLIKNDIKVLCDVRNFPRSMKFGFSKNQLKKICEGLGIIYIHMPGLGIESSKRNKLISQNDYDKLFKDYRFSTLSSNHSDQKDILALIKKFKRVALTCFESDINRCHRFPLSYSILRKYKNSLKVIHI
ncbi:MAG: DUF488 domain-containing protein [Bacteroidetes bacterium]|nr:DUF488 domain-containing protein [Bacteroidota bacterium]